MIITDYTDDGELFSRECLANRLIPFHFPDQRLVDQRRSGFILSKRPG
jgi:hypothetical protein